MTRFVQLLGFELRFYLKRISTYVYFGIFAFLGGFIAFATGGGIPNVQVGLGGSGGLVHVNSPHVLFGLISAMSLFGILIVPAIAGNAVYRDYEANIHPLVFTTPIPKSTFLASRFVGSVLVNTFVLAGLAVGMLVGFHLPGLDPKLLGPTMPYAYVHPYVLIIVPNLLFTGAIFFALAATTRQMLPNYLGGVMMLIGYLLASIYAGDVEHQRLAALIDPFGFQAIDQVAKYWTAAEKNVRFMPLEGVLLLNRVIWMGIGAVVVAIVGARFKFKHLASERVDARRRRVDWEVAASDYEGAVARQKGLPDPARSFGFAARWTQFWSVVTRAFMGIVTNRYFHALIGAGLVFLVFAVKQSGQIYGTSTWPVTYQMIEVVTGSFGLFMIIIVAFYAGELAWQEREVRLSQVTDALPIPNWLPFAGKVTALVLVVMVIEAALGACGMAIQAGKGYMRFEPLLYARQLFGLQLVNWVLLIALMMLVHALVNNKYMGHFIVVLYFVGRPFLSRLGIEHQLYQYGGGTGTTYSDMNRFGPFLPPWAWFKLYWAAVALLFAILTNLFWVRGQETTATWRLALAKQRATRPVLSFAAVAVILAVTFGGYIFWNTNIRNEYRTSFQEEELQARYERDYKQYADLAQPRITKSSVDLTLWPKQGIGEAAGTLTAVNKTSVAIPALHVRVPVEADVKKLELDPPAKETKNDKDLGYRILTFDQPLAPGATMTLAYDLRYEPKGFTNSGASTTIVENGTFINSGVLPSFGYSDNGELQDDDVRRKHHLPPKERMAPVDDLKARQNTYISHDADWIDFDAVVCTDPDQKAIAPGYLKEEFDRGDRHCFRYAMDAPILNFYSFLSARYTIKKDAWHDVAIEVWYHQAHGYNVDKMIDATKKALDYYTTEFGPYQHRQVRIVEFPRYASFAQSFPNTIPYSESIGFIARITDPAKDIDYPFYVTAHEVAHQWFAHQIIGGDVQGSTLLSESLAQYGALKVMEKEYGSEQMGKFLEYEMDRYLQGRSVERKKELPLLLVENQQYIHYNKGSVVLFALADFIGTDKINAAIRTYLNKVKFQGPPYTNSLEFLAELRAVTPPDKQYLLDDMLANITLYDTRVVSAETSQGPDGQWTTTMKLTAKKLRADEKGNEVEVPMDDLVDVGVFLEGPRKKVYDLKPLKMDRMRLKSGDTTLTFVTKDKPQKAGVDPHLLLIDRHLDDNVVAVKDAKAPSA